MNTKGLRISDKKNGKCIPLSELLTNIPEPDQFKWSLQWFDVTPVEGEGRFITELTERINRSEQGLDYTFTSLLKLSEKNFQEIEVLVIGCKMAKNLHRYKKDQEMYETCDIVIEMIDGGFWEVFSKTEIFIDQLVKKYKNIEFLTSDFKDKK